MKVAFSGDQHIGAMHLTTYDEQRTALEALADRAIGAQVTAIVLLGDATHTRAPSPQALALWGDFFRTCDENDIAVVALKGNHEGEGVTSLFEHFRGYVEAVTEPRIVPLTGSGVEVDLACLPWLPDALVRATAAGAMSKEEVAHRLTNVASDILAGFRAQKREGIPLVLATHATIAGAKTSTGFDMGYIPTSDYIIRAEDLAGFDGVFAGHIHRAQMIGVGDPETVAAAYTGSLLPLDFSEDEPKGFLVYDSKRGVADRVTVPTPRVLTTELSVRDDIEQFVTNLTPDSLEGAKVRVQVFCDEATAREFPPTRIEAAAREAGATLVQVEFNVERPLRDEAIIVERAPSGALGDYLAMQRRAGRLDEHAVVRIDSKATEVLTDEREEHPPHGDVMLTAIEVHDFLGVAEAKVEFSDDVYAVTGPVGSGKSTTFVDAIRYALFGESRIGAKMADRLVRNGADMATVAVTLRGADGEYRIVRKTKRGARGATTALDVLEGATFAGDEGGPTSQGWRPRSTGKIADGETHIRRILGELDDETMCVANLVVQRAADSFTRSRPEERKRLLAQAAGLQVYEDLATGSMTRRTLTERSLALLQAKAEPLRDRAKGVQAARDEVARLEQDGTTARLAAEDQSATVAGYREAMEEAIGQANAYDALARERMNLDTEVTRIDRELREWKAKRVLAEAVVFSKAELLRAREDLVVARVTLAGIEREYDEAQAITERRGAVLEEKARLQRELTNLERNRDIERGAAAMTLAGMMEKATLVDAAKCCADEASCVFLDDARAAIAHISETRGRVAAYSSPTSAEGELIERIATIDAATPAQKDVSTLIRRRREAAERVAVLERATGAAERIAQAEATLATVGEAERRLEAHRGEVVGKHTELTGEMVDLGDARNEAARRKARWEEAVKRERELREAAERLATTAATARGRLAALEEAVADLTGIEADLAAAARDVADWDELVRAWRACRVMVLEGSVIPGVEAQANDILRRFPYGLQVALRTQRETRTGDKAETLDIEVLGGRGGLYELCSGGERTTIDTALHIAIALIVSRRSSTRLRFIVVDEPEGLDAPGRAAFAAVIRWLHETFGLMVIAMSHMPDLVDALGGTRIEAVPGEDGSEVAIA